MPRNDACGFLGDKPTGICNELSNSRDIEGINAYPQKTYGESDRMVKSDMSKLAITERCNVDCGRRALKTKLVSWLITMSIKSARHNKSCPKLIKN